MISYRDPFPDEWTKRIISLIISVRDISFLGVISLVFHSQEIRSRCSSAVQNLRGQFWPVLAAKFDPDLRGDHIPPVTRVEGNCIINHLFTIEKNTSFTIVNC